MKKISFNGHSLVLTNSNNEVVHIHSEHKIIGFSINDIYIILIQDWQNITDKENLNIYNMKGDFLFKIPPAPNRLYDNSTFYSNVSFLSENIITIQSADYRYNYDLKIRKFINEVYTK